MSAVDLLVLDGEPLAIALPADRVERVSAAHEFSGPAEELAAVCGVALPAGAPERVIVLRTGGGLVAFRVACAFTFRRLDGDSLLPLPEALRARAACSAVVAEPNQRPLAVYEADALAQLTRARRGSP